MVNKRRVIEDFVKQKKVAVYGVSRNGKKFGNTVFNYLKERKYTVYAINPQASSINNEPCYPDISSLPEKIDTAVLVIPPQQTEQVVPDLIRSGVKRIWIQQGAESENAINICKDNDISVIYGECLLMYLEPVKSFHRFHRWVNRVLGKLPKN